MTVPRCRHHLLHPPQREAEAARQRAEEVRAEAARLVETRSGRDKTPREIPVASSHLTFQEGTDGVPAGGLHQQPAGQGRGRGLVEHQAAAGGLLLDRGPVTSKALCTRRPSTSVPRLLAWRRAGRSWSTLPCSWRSLKGCQTKPDHSLDRISIPLEQ